ncbi:MAG: sulfurtransferase, partial [Gammaproteobacteria bacterium]
MTRVELSLVLAPEVLEQTLGADDVLVVDLCDRTKASMGFVPGAVHLPYGALVVSRPPVGGLLPDEATLAHLLATLGVSPKTHVVAYDEEGGGRAGRLIWTLHAMGHTACSMLDGGLVSWGNEGFPLVAEPATPMPTTTYAGKIDGACVADTEDILSRLDDEQLVLLDTRTPEEYRGEKCLSARAGHIPGAVHFNWVDAMDPSRNLRLKAVDELRGTLAGVGVTPDKDIVVYCQTHHRSSHTYVMLKSLGFTRVRGYPGAWSDWGNRDDTPVTM